MIVRSPANSVRVLREMSEGRTNAQIGSGFGVSAATVQVYLKENIYPMMGCEATAASVKRAEAVGRAYRLQILS